VKMSFALVVSCLVTAAVAAAQAQAAVSPSNADLMGVWVRPMPEVHGEFTYQFDANGSCRGRFAMQITGTYRHSGEALVIHNAAGPAGSSSQWKVVIKGDGLRLQQVQPLQSPSCPFRRSRGPSSTQDALVGSWEPAGCSIRWHTLSELAVVMAVTSDMLFTADNQMQMRSHVELPGSYRIQGRTVSVSCVLPDKDGILRPSEYEYSIEGGKPTLQSGGAWDRFVKR
jgi:hypothetical protein